MSQAKVIFSYKDIKIMIPCQSNEKIKYIIERFITMVQIDTKKIIFLYNGYKVNEELNFEELANEEKKSKKEENIIIFVINNIIKCPNCQNNIFIEIKDNKKEDIKIDVYDSKNNHKIEEIRGTNNLTIKSESDNNFEYKNINDINKEELKQKNEISEEKYTHKNKKNLWYKSINENQVNDLNQYIGKYIQNINEIISLLKDLLNNIIIFNNRINSNNRKKNKEYETPQNEDELLTYKTEIIEIIKEIINENNIENKFKKIMNIYNIMNKEAKNRINYNNYIIGEMNILENDLNKY